MTFFSNQKWCSDEIEVHHECAITWLTYLFFPLYEMGYFYHLYKRSATYTYGFMPNFVFGTSLWLTQLSEILKSGFFLFFFKSTHFLTRSLPNSQKSIVSEVWLIQLVLVENFIIKHLIGPLSKSFWDLKNCQILL